MTVSSLVAVILYWQRFVGTSSGYISTNLSFLDRLCFQPCTFPTDPCQHWCLVSLHPAKNINPQPDCRKVPKHIMIDLKH